MRARDVMTAPVVCAGENATVGEVAKLMLSRGISAVPVLGPDRRLAGIVSEGDLLRRVETGTERQPPWWLRIFGEPDAVASQYAKAHGLHARDVMTRELVTAGEEATLAEIAELLERHRIKRVPIMRDGDLVGIVSRANLLHALASQPAASVPPSRDDAALRKRVQQELSRAGIDAIFVNVVASGGEVHLWGAVRSQAQLDTARIAAESVAGAARVRSHLSLLSPNVPALS